MLILTAGVDKTQLRGHVKKNFIMSQLTGSRRRVESLQLYPLKRYFAGTILTESAPLMRVESRVAPVRTASVLSDDKSERSAVLK